MGSASLALLKGKKADAPAEEVKTAAAPKEAKPAPAAKEAAPKPAPEPAAEETVEFDVDKASAAEIDKVIKENDITVPDGWKTMKVGEKRAWMKSTFDDSEASKVSDVNTEEAKPSTAKEVATGKYVAKSDVKEGEVLAANALSDMVHEIENLKEKEARSLIGSLINASGMSDFKLGGVLSLVQANQWFSPYASFREFIEAEYGIEYRKGMYLIQIYNDLVESKVPYDAIKHLGWTKLQKLSKVLDLDNYQAWVKTAEKLTVIQLSEAISNAAKAGAQGQLSDQSEPAKTVTTKTFKVHDDQRATIDAALEKARTAAGTEVDTVALEFICLDYLGSSKAAASAVPLATQLKNAGVDDALAALGAAFPEHDFSVAAPE